MISIISYGQYDMNFSLNPRSLFNKSNELLTCRATQTGSKKLICEIQAVLIAADCWEVIIFLTSD